MQRGACLAAGAACGADAPGAVVAAVCLSLLAGELTRANRGRPISKDLRIADEAGGGLILGTSIDLYHGCCGSAGCGSGCGGGCGGGGG
jgi:hypothetical protein